MFIVHSRRGKSWQKAEFTMYPYLPKADRSFSSIDIALHKPLIDASTLFQESE